MKHWTRMLVFAVFVAAVTFIAFAQKTPTNADEQALIALDKKWTAAELRLNDEDRKTIDGIVAADYTGISPFGEVQDKAKYMAALQHTEDADVADEYVVHFYSVFSQPPAFRFTRRSQHRCCNMNGIAAFPEEWFIRASLYLVSAFS